MKIRIITAIIALPLLISTIYFGGWFLCFMIALISLIGLNELLKAFNADKIGIQLPLGLATISYYYIIFIGKTYYLIYIIAALIIMLLLYYVFSFPKTDFSKISLSVFSFFYVVFLLSFIVLIRDTDKIGIYLVWLVFLIAFGSDTFAYFSGYFLGKNKLAPNLSPKKTIEGSIGGVIGAIILCLGYGYFMYSKGVITDLSNMKWMVLLGGVGSALSQIGDLAASGIKRQSGIKDFGKLLPGHGGVLDRFDSNLFTAPFVYIIMNLLLKI